ncbi:MAG: IS630 family transposase [Cyclobacteriaceae bacterium]
MRKRAKDKPDAALYQVRQQGLALLEEQSLLGHIDLYYGDETRVAEEGYVPYGWQFADEQVAIKSRRGKAMNYFGLLRRDNHLLYQACSENITADLVITFLDELSLKINKYTVIVLDNARAHTAKKVKACLQDWQQRGLYIFYLPPYSPHLNIIERLWKEVKEGWIRPSDYQTADQLFYAVDRILANLGNKLRLNFKSYQSSN